MRNDLQKVDNLIGSSQLLPDNLWAAYVWRATGIPTGSVIAHQDRETRRLEYFIAVESGGAVIYRHIEEIAMKDSVWDMAAHSKLGEWIDLISDVESHSSAFNSYTHGAKRSSAESARSARRRGFLQGWAERHPGARIEDMPDVDKVLSEMGITISAAKMVAQRRHRSLLDTDPFA